MSLYSKRGVSAQKEEVHKATEKLDKGLYPYAFCKVYPDYLTGHDDWVNVMHADGAGTKSILAYLYWKETGDLSVWKGIAQDAVVMNLDDLLCVGIHNDLLFSSTIDRNKTLIPGEVLETIINGTQELFDTLRGFDVNIHYNRFYLLGAMILPVVLPFFKIKIWHQPQNPVNQVVYQTLDVLTVGYGETDGQLPVNTPTADLFTVDHLLYIVYAAGTLALLVILAKSLLHIRRIARQYPHEFIDRLKFYTTSEPGTPFSFFHSIFWNDQLSFNSKEGQQIFRHELFHIRQRHSTDVLLAELITALFWCNPFFHIAKKELKAIHEFLADQYAVSDNDRYAYAELLVMQTLQTPHIPVTHRFFQNHIKRRIAMITHLNARNYNYWSRLMVLPVSIVLFCSFALYTQQPVAGLASSDSGLENAPTKKALTVVIDAGHGGTDAGASSLDGQVKEKDIALQISLKIQQLAPAYNVNVIMTRADNELPTHATIKEDGIKARTTIAQQSKAAAFVSIHMAATDDTDKTRNGVEVYITRGNEKWMDPSKQLGTAVLQSISTLYTTNPALLQRKQKGIWVLDHSPCPAILIECGYITNDKDLAFFSNSSKQEAIAKKILEGIVSYQKQLTAKTTSEQSTLPQN